MVTEPEAGKLIAFIRALGLPIPDEPPEIMRRAWALSLTAWPYHDLERAALRLTGATHLIRPPDLIREAKRERSKRLDGLPAPNADPDDAAAWLKELRALTAYAANGGRPGVPLKDDLATYARGGVSFTGSHAAIPTHPVDPARIAAAKTQARTLGIPTDGETQ